MKSDIRSHHQMRMISNADNTWQVLADIFLPFCVCMHDCEIRQNTLVDETSSKTPMSQYRYDRMHTVIFYNILHIMHTVTVCYGRGRIAAKCMHRLVTFSDDELESYCVGRHRI